jgi:hypothetical protein
VPIGIALVHPLGLFQSELTLSLNLIDVLDSQQHFEYLLWTCTVCVNQVVTVVGIERGCLYQWVEVVVIRELCHV